MTSILLDFGRHIPDGNNVLPDVTVLVVVLSREVREASDQVRLLHVHSDLVRQGSVAWIEHGVPNRVIVTIKDIYGFIASLIAVDGDGPSSAANGSSIDLLSAWLCLDCGQADTVKGGLAFAGRFSLSYHSGILLRSAIGSLWREWTTQSQGREVEEGENVLHDDCWERIRCSKNDGEVMCMKGRTTSTVVLDTQLRTTTGYL